MLRTELARLIRAAGAEAPPEAVICPAGEFAAGLPDPARFGADGARLALRLTGRGCVSAADFLGNTLYFTLTPSFYDEALALIDLPLPTVADCGEDDAGYAMARMLMLGRKGGDGCPDLASCQRTLWLALGVLDRSDKRHISRILDLTAAAVSDLGKELPPRMRRDMLARCGSLGRAVAALLFYGSEVIKK